MTTNTSDNKYACEKLIVAPTIAKGATHTTIASALADAITGDNIVVKPGIYTEDLTLKAGVSITAFRSNPLSPNVLIIGKATFSSLGTSTLTGVMLQTRGSYLLSLSGSSASNVFLIDCFLKCSDHTGIQFTSSSQNSNVYIKGCYCDVGKTNITLFISSSAGKINLVNTNIINSGLSIQPSASSSGEISLEGVLSYTPFIVSLTGKIEMVYTRIDTSQLNVPCVQTLVNASSAVNIETSNFNSGSARCLITTPGTTMYMRGQNVLRSTSPDGFAATGDGTLFYTPMSFTGSARSIGTKFQHKIPISGMHVLSSTPGKEISLEIENTDNTVARTSSAIVAISTSGNTQIGDPTLVLNNANTRAYAIGIDTNDSEALKITTAAASTVTPSDGKTLLYYDHRADYLHLSVLDADVRFSAAGDKVGLAAVNEESTNADSSSNVAAGVVGARSGDPFFQLDIEGQTTNKFGLDNSDEDKYKYMIGSNADATNLNGTAALIMTQSGEFTYPLQPAFLVQLRSNKNNVTGTGRIYTVQFDDKIFDQGSDYNLATSTFTAPVTGKYQFNVEVTIAGITRVRSSEVRIVCSNLEYRNSRLLPSGLNTGNRFSLNIIKLIDLDAGDTAIVKIYAHGESSNAVDVLAQSSRIKFTTFSGFLAV